MLCAPKHATQSVCWSRRPFAFSVCGCPGCLSTLHTPLHHSSTLKEAPGPMCMIHPASSGALHDVARLALCRSRTPSRSGPPGASCPARPRASPPPSLRGATSSSWATRRAASTAGTPRPAESPPCRPLRSALAPLAISGAATVSASCALMTRPASFQVNEHAPPIAGDHANSECRSALLHEAACYGQLRHYWGSGCRGR